MNSTSSQYSPIWPDLYGIDTEGPYLVATKCSSCNRIALGLRRICPDCWKEDKLHGVRIGRNGTIYTYTIVYQPPSGFSDEYVVGYIDVEDDVRVFAHLSNDEETLKIGQRVVLAIEPVKEGGDGQYLDGPIYKAKDLASG